MTRGAYKCYQQPRYFGTDAIVSEGFELVWDDGNDQGVDEKIRENSCFRYWVSSKCTNAARRRNTPNITTFRCSASNSELMHEINAYRT